MILSTKNLRWYHLPLLPVGALAIVALVAIELPGLAVNALRERLRRA